MDEFNELDREIERLKLELSSQDETLKKFREPVTGDYWQRRFDEEKILWNKKMLSREEERKALESKLAQQQSTIDQYHRKLDELERKFEGESREWEGRLRAREADLLVEKNRLLSEEKVRHIEIENNRLLEQISDLNAKITEVKEDHARDTAQLNERFGQERGIYDEKIKAYLERIEALEAKIAENESRASKQLDEFEKARQDYSEQLKKINLENEKLLIEKAEVQKEKAALENTVVTVKSKANEDKQRAEEQVRGVDGDFVSNLRQHTGPLLGLVQFMTRHRTRTPANDIVKALVQNIENEIETYSVISEVSPRLKAPYALAGILTDSDAATLEKAGVTARAVITPVSRGGIEKTINALKPRAAVVSAVNAKTAVEIKRRWPFMPVLVMGELKSRVAKKLIGRGIEIIAPPYAAEEVLAAVDKACAHSIALPEFWGQVKVRRQILAPLAAASVVALSVIIAGFGIYSGGIGRYIALAGNPAVSTPYAQPSNLAADGKNLWVCDWLGQSLYKHGLGRSVPLEKIFYFPGKHLSALSFSGGYMWSADPLEKKIYKHGVDDTMAVIAAYPAPGAAPSGLAGDGRSLWSCDAASAQIFKHKLDADLSVEAAYKSPGENPSGLYFDGTSLWSADSKSNKIYRHRQDAALSVEAAFSAPEYGQKGYNVSGIAGNGKTLWLCSEKAGKIFRYTAEKLQEVK